MKTIQNTSGVTKSVVVALMGWLALVLFLGAHGRFMSPQGTPPLPIVLGVVVPIAVFAIAFWVSRAFRDYVLNFDLRLAAGIQAWRFAGLTFLALQTNGVLPGTFAWPAGIGDMAVGITAPWILLALIRRPHFAASRWFVAWNWFGVADLVTAVGSGGLTAVLAHGAPGEATMGPIAQLPLILIPAYIVPLLFMVHISALLQARRVAALVTNAPMGKERGLTLSKA